MKLNQKQIETLARLKRDAKDGVLEIQNIHPLIEAGFSFHISFEMIKGGHKVYVMDHEGKLI